MELCSLPAIYLGPNYGGGNEDDGDVKWESRRVEETNRFSEYYNQYNKCKIKELGWYWYEEKLAQAQRKQAGLLKRWQRWAGSQRLSACQAGRAWCEGCGFPAEERRYAKRDAMADSTLWRKSKRGWGRGKEFGLYAGSNRVSLNVNREGQDAVKFAFHKDILCTN